MSMSDAALEKDPAVAKAIALDYITLDDLKSGSAISQVIQRHADLVFAGLPVRGPEVQAAMDKINRQIGNAKANLSMAQNILDQDDAWFANNQNKSWFDAKVLSDYPARRADEAAAVTHFQGVLDALKAQLDAVG